MTLPSPSAAGAAALVAIAISWPRCGVDEEPGRVSASGSFEVDKLKVVSSASGELVSFSIDEGDEVDADQVVAVVDSEDLELKLEELSAALAAARARLEIVEQGARPEDIKQLRALKKEVALQKQLADTNLERMEELHAKGGVSKSSLDEVETKRDVTATKLQQVRWQLLKAKHGARAEEVEAAAAAVDQIEAGIAQVEKMIEDRTIHSPTGGTVLETHAHEGELVTLGQLLAVVADMETMDLVVYVSEKDLPRIRLGQEARVSIDAFEDRSFAGTVTHIASEAEFTPSTVQTEEERVKLVFEVTVTVDNPEGHFKPGLPGDVTFAEE
jgi:HlyD family secretion protein